MDKKNEITEIKLDLLENGLDFVISALDPIIKPENENHLKYSILHLSAGVELILKERLRQEHWSFLFENINNANESNLNSGDFQSVNFEVTLQRLANICDVKFNDKEKRYLKELKKRRNKIEHFAFKEINVAIKSLASKVLSIILSFITKSFDEKSLTENSKKQIEILRKKIKGFTEFTSLRIAQIKTKLESVEKEYEIIKCPMCYQKTFVLSDDFNCLFCGYTDNSNNVAENYIENILGINKYLEIKEKGYLPLEQCPDCADYSLVDNGEHFICFSCLNVWSREDINECSGCGQLYIKEDVDYDICNGCMEYHYKKLEEDNY